MKCNVFIYNLAFFFCLFLFNSCGLDTVVYIYPPETSYNTPRVTNSTYTTSSPYDTAYFEFETNDEKNHSDDYTFEGTAVYYKIYNNYSTMDSNISAIESLNSSTTASASANALIQTYKFQQLGTKTESKSPLIESSSNNRVVYIRLTNYNENASTEYTATVKIGVERESKGQSAAQDEFYPMRSIEDNRFTFDFGRKQYNDEYVVPKSGDDDVTYGTASSEGIWYVALFAVGVGHDNSFSSQYSNVLFLGSVAINSNSEEN